jgi:hypothetical protein
MTLFGKNHGKEAPVTGQIKCRSYKECTVVAKDGDHIGRGRIEIFYTSKDGGTVTINQYPHVGSMVFAVGDARLVAVSLVRLLGNIDEPT